jgi:hypothetical protein
MIFGIGVTGRMTVAANSQGIPANELPAATIEFKYDGLWRSGAC